MGISQLFALIPSRIKKNKGAGVILCVGAVAWLVMLGSGLSGYSGSKAVYAVFSMVMGAMVVSGFAQRTSYGYLFLTIFLWLGFWLKLTIHLILNYPFVEPIGSFSGWGADWDEVLVVATVACLGVVLGRYLFAWVTVWARTGYVAKVRSVPCWYAQQRKWLWTGVILIFVASLVVNHLCGVHRVGLPPNKILMWPLNSILSWWLNIGAATGIAVLTWWDIGLQKDARSPFIAILTEAFLSSLSVLSRSIYVFHSIPQFLAVHRNLHKLRY
jgi:hypothetical protein